MTCDICRGRSTVEIDGVVHPCPYCDPAEARAYVDAEGADVLTDRWLTLREAATYLGLSEDTMRDRIALIPGASRTMGATGDWRVKASMIDRWLARGRETASET